MKRKENKLTKKKIEKINLQSHFVDLVFDPILLTKLSSSSLSLPTTMAETSKLHHYSFLPPSAASSSSGPKPKQPAPLSLGGSLFHLSCRVKEVMKLLNGDKTEFWSFALLVAESLELMARAHPIILEAKAKF